MIFRETLDNHTVERAARPTDSKETARRSRSKRTAGAAVVSIVLQEQRGHSGRLRMEKEGIAGSSTLMEHARRIRKKMKENDLS